MKTKAAAVSNDGDNVVGDSDSDSDSASASSAHAVADTDPPVRNLVEDAGAGAGAADAATQQLANSDVPRALAGTYSDDSWKKWRQHRDDGNSISESQPWTFGPIRVHVCWIRYRTTNFARDIEVASFDAGKPSPLGALCRTPRSLGIDNLRWQRHNVFHEHPFFVAMLDTGRMPVISFDALIGAIAQATCTPIRTISFRIVKAVRNFRATYMTHLPAVDLRTMFPYVRGVSGKMRVFPAYILPFLYIFAKDLDGKRDALIIAEARKAGPVPHGGAQMPVSATAISRFFQSLMDLLQSLELSCASKDLALMRLRRLSWYQLSANIESVQATLREQARAREHSLAAENSTLRRSVAQLRRRATEKEVVTGQVKRART